MQVLGFLQERACSGSQAFCHLRAGPRYRNAIQEVELWAKQTPGDVRGLLPVVWSLVRSRGPARISGSDAIAIVPGLPLGPAVRRARRIPHLRR